MKLCVLLAVEILLLLPRGECKATDTSGVYSIVPAVGKPVLPILMRMGKEYFIRLESLHKSGPLRANVPTVKYALQPQLTRGLTQGHVAEVRDALTANSATDRDPRSDQSPISLDLTFHLLREVLQMARAERLAHQASNNRLIMDTFGK